MALLFPEGRRGDQWEIGGFPRRFRAGSCFFLKNKPPDQHSCGQAPNDLQAGAGRASLLTVAVSRCLKTRYSQFTPATALRCNHLSSFYKRSGIGTERVIKQPKVTQRGSGTARTQTPKVWSNLLPQMLPFPPSEPGKQ